MTPTVSRIAKVRRQDVILYALLNVNVNLSIGYASKTPRHPNRSRSWTSWFRIWYFSLYTPILQLSSNVALRSCLNSFICRPSYPIRASSVLSRLFYCGKELNSSWYIVGSLVIGIHSKSRLAQSLKPGTKRKTMSNGPWSFPSDTSVKPVLLLSSINSDDGSPLQKSTFGLMPLPCFQFLWNGHCSHKVLPFALIFIASACWLVSQAFQSWFSR